MKEKIIIIFVAVLLGLLATTAIFYIYESSKKIPKTEIKQTQDTEPNAGQKKSGIFLTIEDPKDESVVSKRTLQIKGETNAGNTVIISSPSDDSVIQPAADGKFSTTVTINTDVNKITARAISASGEEIKQELIVTYSTEDF